MRRATRGVNSLIRDNAGTWHALRLQGPGRRRGGARPVRPHQPSLRRPVASTTDGPEGAPKRTFRRASNLIAHAAIGIEPHLARALDGAGVGHRPVLDLGRRAARDFQRLVMRLGRQRHDQVEGARIDIVERLGVMAMDVDADLVERGGDEAVDARLPARRPNRCRTPGRRAAWPAPRPSANARNSRCRRTARWREGRSSPSHHDVMCRAQIRVNSRRAVSRSISILPSSRSRNSSEPSLCRPRRPMSSASICEGLSFLMAA